MRFPSAVLLADLAIAPVCAERKKVSDERRVVDSTLSVDGFNCGSGGLRPSGNRPSGAHPRGGGRRGLPTALRRGATVTTTMAHAPTRTAHAHRDDGTTKRDDDDEMRNARRARRQDETATATRASKSAARIGGTDKSNNQLDVAVASALVGSGGRQLRW